MQNSGQRQKIFRTIAVLAVIGVVALVVAFFYRDRLRDILDLALASIRRVGPTPFFLGMALLPAVGFPVLPFSLAAGSVFGSQLGLPWVCTLVVVSIFANLSLTYWLSHYAFRPLLERWITKLGYSLPRVADEDRLSLTVLVRATPGPPFFVQNYLLGLSGVPFGMYAWVSCLFAGSYSVAVVLFGDSLIKGRGKMAVIALSALVVLSVLVQWIRRRYQKKKLPDSP